MCEDIGVNQPSRCGSCLDDGRNNTTMVVKARRVEFTSYREITWLFTHKKIILVFHDLSPAIKKYYTCMGSGEHSSLDTAAVLTDLDEVGKKVEEFSKTDGDSMKSAEKMKDTENCKMVLCKLKEGDKLNYIQWWSDIISLQANAIDKGREGKIE